MIVSRSASGCERYSALRSLRNRLPRCGRGTCRQAPARAVFLRYSALHIHPAAPVVLRVVGDYAIAAISGLELHHRDQAMTWLGEELSDNDRTAARRL